MRTGVPQMVNPLATVVKSVLQNSVCPAIMSTLAGPLVAQYFSPNMLTQSK
jgi:hypothetical protein